MTSAEGERQEIDCLHLERLRRLGGEPAGLHVEKGGALPHSPSSLSSPRLPGFPSPETDCSRFWRDPDLGGRRLHFGHSQSVTCCVTLDSHFTSLVSVSVPRRYLRYLRHSPPVPGPVVPLELCDPRSSCFRWFCLLSASPCGSFSETW